MKLVKNKLDWQIVLKAIHTFLKNQYLITFGFYG